MNRLAFVPTATSAWSRQQNQYNSAASTSAGNLSASWSGYDQYITGSMLFLIPGCKSSQFSCRQSSEYFWRWDRTEETEIYTICLPARRQYTNSQYRGHLCGSFGVFQVRNRRIIICAFASYHGDQSWVHCDASKTTIAHLFLAQIRTGNCHHLQIALDDLSSFENQQCLAVIMTTCMNDIENL
jgi:hypothetical protein